MLSKTHTKYIQSLQHKKFRELHGAFIAEGPKLVPELLQSGKFICTEILAEAGWIAAQQHLLSRQPGVPVTEVKDFELQKISALTHAHEVLAIFEKPTLHTAPVVKGKISLVLDGIQDPGNFGTIIRTADWFGIELLVCSNDTADCYNPKVVQSTMGSLGRVAILYVDLPQWLSQQHKIPIIATAMEGDNIAQLKNSKEALLIIGNEGKGISPEVMALSTQKISIERKGKAESLNAAVAAGIVLANV